VIYFRICQILYSDCYQNNKWPVARESLLQASSTSSTVPEAKEGKSFVQPPMVIDSNSQRLKLGDMISLKKLVAFVTI